MCPSSKRVIFVTNSSFLTRSGISFRLIFFVFFIDDGHFALSGQPLDDVVPLAQAVIFVIQRTVAASQELLPQLQMALKPPHLLAQVQVGGYQLGGAHSAQLGLGVDGGRHGRGGGGSRSLKMKLFHFQILNCGHYLFIILGAVVVVNLLDTSEFRSLSSSLTMG